MFGAGQGGLISGVLVGGILWCPRFCGVPALAEGRWGHQRGGKGVAVLKWGTHKSPPASPHLSPIFTGEAAALFWQLLAGKYWLKPKTRRLTHGVLTNTGRGPWRVWGAASPGDRGTLQQGGGNLICKARGEQSIPVQAATCGETWGTGEGGIQVLGCPFLPLCPAQESPCSVKKPRGK